MKAGAICSHRCVTITPNEDLSTAAKLMRDEHVGYLVVVEGNGKSERGGPVGVITDRDIVVAVVAREADPFSLRVGDVMSGDPIVARSDEPIESVARTMRDHGIRRVPLIDAEGHTRGVVSIDDLLAVLASQLSDLAALIRNEQRIEQVTRG